MIDALGLVVWSVDSDPGFELDSRADQGHEFGGCDPAPVGLGGLDEFEGHSDSSGPGTGPLGRVGPQPDGRERLRRRPGMILVLRIPNLGEGLLRARMGGFRQRCQDVAGLVHFMWTST